MKHIALSLALLFVCSAGVSALPQKAVLDFDGDNKTDYVVVRGVGAGDLIWYLQRSTDGFLGQAWGGGFIDQLVPGDYDGDGKWDIAVWRAGGPASFYILQSMTNTLSVVTFGRNGDYPLNTQDYDGDGKADPTVVRNLGSGVPTWYIQRSLLGFTALQFGGTHDLPVRGDFDGDGKADIAVYRSEAGTPANTFYVLRSSDGGLQAQNFGLYSMDYILPGDFDGDGKTDYAVYRHGRLFCSPVWLGE